MRKNIWLGLLAASVVAPAVAASDTASSDPVIEPIGSYDTGLGGDGAEIISVREKDGTAALTNVAGSVDILDVSDPTTITRLRRVDVSAFGTPNSTSIHPSKDLFVVAHGEAGLPGTLSVWRVSDGVYVGSVPAGIQPDSVQISPNGRWAVVANEAQGVDTGDNGGAGSITMVDLASVGRPSGLIAYQLALPSLAGRPGFSTGRTDDAAELPVDNSPATLEPESVAFDTGGRFAYITLQENNGVIKLDLSKRTMVFFGLGEISHLADLTDGGGYNPTATLTAFREPDGIATVHNGRYFVTADEGDTQDAAGNGAPRGGRSVSVFDAATGAFVGDTGRQIDDAAAAAGRYPDVDRSDRGGSEPEVLAATTFRGQALVAVGLERANAVALLSVDNPANPVVLGLGATGVGPEGVEFLRIGTELYVLAANEVDGTVTALAVYPT